MNSFHGLGPTRHPPLIPQSISTFEGFPLMRIWSANSPNAPDYSPPIYVRLPTSHPNIAPPPHVHLGAQSPLGDMRVPPPSLFERPIPPPTLRNGNIPPPAWTQSRNMGHHVNQAHTQGFPPQPHRNNRHFHPNAFPAPHHSGPRESNNAQRYQQPNNRRGSNYRPAYRPAQQRRVPYQMNLAAGQTPQINHLPTLSRRSEKFSINTSSGRFTYQRMGDKLFAVFNSNREYIMMVNAEMDLQSTLNSVIAASTGHQ
uniref:Trithorax group protein osa n=1 Tax=Caenorhabditis tropicalis TaxID=1561998 RepID=A0A1I7TZS9_9PELO